VPGLGEGGVGGGARNPEVDQVDKIPRVRDQDVRRLDIAMHQPRLVGAIQCRRNLFDHRDRIRRAEPAPVCGHVGAQIAALDQPHVDIKSTVDLTEAVDGHHVRIVEARRRACLAAEAFLKVAVLGQMRGGAA
jgi:hypothetical protein